jgi:hypothetical protein
MSGQVDQADHAGQFRGERLSQIRVPQKRIVLISTYNKALDFIGMRIRNENCSPARIHAAGRLLLLIWSGQF